MDPGELLSDEAFARRIAIGLLRDRDAADDLVQEAWLAVLERPPGSLSRPRAFLRGLLHRLSLRKRRTEGRRRARELAAARAEAQGDSSALVARAEIHQRTVAAVVALDEPYRTTVLLRFFEDLTPEQIAARESIPVETAKTRLKRGLSMLRARLEREGRDWRTEWAIALGDGSWLRTEDPSPSGSTAALRWGTAALAGAAAGLVIWSVATRPGEGRAAPELASREQALAGRASAAELTPPAGTERDRLALEPGVAPAAAAESLWTGRITDDAGRAVMGARLSLGFQSNDNLPPVGKAISDEDGRFSCSLAEWTRLSPSQRGLLGLRLRVWAYGHAPAERMLEAGPGGLPAALELELTAGRVLTGRVVDEAGEPLQLVGALVWASGTEPGAPQRMGSTDTDPEGWFALGLEAGERATELLLQNSDLGLAYLDSAALPAQTSGDIELGTITLRPGHVLRGRCTHPDGSPVRGFGVIAMPVENDPAGGHRPVAQRPRSELAEGKDGGVDHTDEHGRFELMGLRAGLYRLGNNAYLLADGAAWSTDGPELELVLPRHHLALEIVGPGGEFLREARFAMTRLSEAGEPVGSPKLSLTHGRQPVKSLDVAPGERLAILAAVPGCAVVEERVDIPPLPYETAVRLQVAREDRRGTLALRPSRGPSDAWRIDLCAPLSGVPLPGLRNLVPSADGRVSGLPLGSYRVRIAPDFHGEPGALPEHCAASAEPSVTLTEGETELAFDVRPASRVRLVFGSRGASDPAATPIRVPDLEGSSGSERLDWMNAMLTSARGALELHASADPTRALRRLTGLRARAGQFLELVVPAVPLHLSVRLDGGEAFDRDLAPAPGETLEVALPLAATPAPAQALHR